MTSNIDSNTPQLKHASWLDSHTFDNCKLDRKKYGEFLFNYIKSEKDGFVLNIDSSWGSGKTEFLKRMYTASYNAHHPVIYIDAWESDFSKDPLSVIAFELLGQIEDFMAGEPPSQLIENLTELKETLSTFKQNIAIFAGLGTTVLGLGYAVGKDFTNATFEKSPTENEKLIEKLSKNYQAQTSAIKAIKSQLSIITELLSVVYEMETPLIILVDELDRCRPTYAIEMLEVVKHFFNTKNVVFIIATDTKQLCSSVESVYGHNFTAKTYLKRFFDRTAQLPAPDFETYLLHQNLDFEAYSEIKLYPTGNQNFTIENIITILLKTYELEVRDLDQLLAQVHACLRVINSTSQGAIINLVVLFSAVIEKHKGLESFSDRGDIDETDDVNIPNDFEHEKDFSSLDLISSSFKSITRVTHVDENYHRQSTRIILQIPYFLDDYIEHNAGIKRLEFNNQIKNMLVQAANQTDLFWKWSQYKQCVELAGYIS